MAALFAGERFDRVIHLAAQAGVRYSLTTPEAYVDSNLVGFMNVLEGCRHAAFSISSTRELERLRRQLANAVLRT
jgi:nucleoside-diphosphate-sugar epimerase